LPQYDNTHHKRKIRIKNKYANKIVNLGRVKMPISRSEFESRQILSEIEKRVISFLERNRDKAFTFGEIMDGIHFQTDFSDFLKAILSGISIMGFPLILNNLVTKGKIRMDIINGNNYYAAK
jgi:hypothetical protein